MSARPPITCADCAETRPRYAQGRCKSCYSRGRAAGTVTRQVAHRPWTLPELALLDRQYHLGIAAMMRRLGRSESAVKQMAWRRGLDLRAEYNFCDLALAVGCSRSTATLWHRRGLLVATGRGYLSEAALHRFFCTQGPLWRKYPCPDAGWIASLLTDPALRRAHGCNAREET